MLCRVYSRGRNTKDECGIYPNHCFPLIVAKGSIAEKNGSREMLRMKNRIPDTVLKEIFPRKLKRSLSSEQIYLHLKKMIISGKLKKGQKLLQEKTAQCFRVSRVTVAIAFSQLKKYGLIVSKNGVGSFVA
jgi:hypothetical protein